MIVSSVWTTYARSCKRRAIARLRPASSSTIPWWWPRAVPQLPPPFHASPGSLSMSRAPTVLNAVSTSHVVPGRSSDPASSRNSWLPDLAIETRFELCSRDGMPAVAHVALEASQDLSWVDLGVLECVPEIEEITSLPTLVEGSQLRGQELAQLESGDVGLAGEPGAVDSRRFFFRPSTEKCSRELISILRRILSGGVSSDSKR